MLVRNFATLLCSGVLAASALKLAALEDLYDSAGESTFDLSNAQQVPFGPSGMLSQDHALEHDVENDMAQMSQKAEDRTIYQVLSDNPKFSRLVKIINISDDIVSLLNDTSASITFFAVPNRALRPPHRRKHHPGKIDALFFDDPTAVLETYSSYDLPDIMAEIEELESCLNDGPDKERRKKFIRILVKAILLYNVIPKDIALESLTHNTTYATKLIVPDNALDKEALRVRVSAKVLPPSIAINFFSKVVRPNIGAKNGIIHVVNHPVLPPPSIFQELFLAPRIFGAVTSGLQRIDLANAVEWRYVPGKSDDDKKWKVEGTSSATFFAPSNLAFKKLPWKLELFLFSPFGEKVLKKLLQFHVVPGIVLHSDYLHNATSGETISANGWPDVFHEPDSEILEDSPLRFEFDEDIDFGTIRKGLPFSYRHDDSRPTELRPDHGHDEERHHPLPPLPPAQDTGRGHYHWFKPPPPPSEDNPHHPHSPPPLPLSQSARGRRPLRKGDHNGPCKERGNLPHLPGLPRKPVFSANVTLSTLLPNHWLHVHVEKVKHRLPIPGHKKDIYTTKLFVNHQSIAVSDVPSRNGAVHIINKVLNPRRRHHRPHKPEQNKAGHDFVDQGDNNEWKDWEDWLLQWAEEN